MKASNVRGMTNEELALAERNTAEQLWKVRFQQHTGQLSNTAQLGELKKNLARIRTIRRERDMGLTVAPEEG